MKFNKKSLFFITILGIIIFISYLKYIIYPTCWQAGYTHCAAIGQDFFALYQAGYNIFHNIFVYGKSGGLSLVTPYFMFFKYFPITPFVWGIPTLVFSSAMNAYYGYLVFSILLHIASIYLIVKISKKLKAQTYQIVFAIFIWLTYFSLTSEWRMGQFNHLAGMFLLGAVGAEIFSNKILSALAWILSLSWKPQAIFVAFYFWLTKNKLAISLFFLLFILFTTGYLAYFQTQNIPAFHEFFKNILVLENHHAWQVGYIDNFSVNAFWGQIFYPTNPKLYYFVSKSWSIFIIFMLFWSTWKSSKNIYNLNSRIYLLLFTAVSMSLFHKEVWESHLTFWLPTLITLLLITKNKKEWFFILICSLILASPTTFYYYSIYKLEWLKTLMIGMKVLPQLALYCYLIRKISTKKPYKFPY